MGKFDGMLFCTDLDGTLYRSDKTVSEENLEAIAYFKSEGGIFTFITGRPPISAKDIWNLIKPNAPYGCFNGAGIYDQRTKSFLWRMTLPKEVMDLVAYVDEHMPDIGIQLNAEQQIYSNKDNPAMMDLRRAQKLPEVFCHYTDVQEPVVKVIFAHRDGARIEALQDVLNRYPKAKDYDYIRSEHSLYEVLPKGVSKGVALEKMAQLLGVDMRKTIAVGDYENDVSMIRRAGIGIAVANACPAAKAAADHITVDNDSHAIARIIRELG